LIYPPELEVKETTDTASSTSFLDLYLEFDDSGQLSTKIYDKRESARRLEGIMHHPKGSVLCLLTLGHISAYNMDNTILLLLLHNGFI
jgi:hypothetical protein